MRNAAGFIICLWVSSAGLASDCDCTNYPFKPNPPCYGKCVALLSKKDVDLSSIKGMDANISRSIKALSSRPDRSAINFSSIQGQQDLEEVLRRPVKQKVTPPDTKDPRENGEELLRLPAKQKITPPNIGDPRGNKFDNSTQR